MLADVCSRRENGSGVCLDLQVIDNIPGAKVEEDMETHHVLAGNLYKPRRRVSFSLLGAPRFLKVVEIVLEGTQDVSGSLKSLLRYLKKIRTGEQVSLGNEMCLSAGVLCVQYQSHYSRHFMPLGEQERQDREVFQRNMRSRMETFKSTRYKRHKKERSLKKVRRISHRNKL